MKRPLQRRISRHRKYKILSCFLIALSLLLSQGSAAGSESAISLSSQPDLASAAQKCLSYLDRHQCPGVAFSVCKLAVNLSNKGSLNSKILASNLSNLGSCFNYRGNYLKARRAHFRALKIREALFGKRHTDVANSLNEISAVFVNTGNYKVAESYQRRAMEIFEENHDSTLEEKATMFNNLATIVELSGRIMEAKELYEKALELSRSDQKISKLNLSENISNFADYLATLGSYGKAEQLQQEAIQILLKTGESRHPSLAKMHNNLGYIFTSTGRYQDAEKEYKIAFMLQKQQLGENHPDTLSSLNNIAMSAFRLGRFQEAEACMEKVLSSQKLNFGDNHPYVTSEMNNLASILSIQGKMTEAESILRRALKINLNKLGTTHLEVAATLNNLAELLLHAGRYSEVKSILAQAISIWNKKLGQHPDKASSLNNLSILLSNDGEFSMANRVANDALRIRRKRLGKMHPLVAQSLNMLGMNFISWSLPDRALPLLEQAVMIQEFQLRQFLSEPRMHSYLRTIRHEEDVIYSLARTKPDYKYKSFALRLALLRKGRELDTGITSNKFLQRHLELPEIKEKFEKWKAIKKQRETLLFSENSSTGDSAAKRKIETIQFAVDALEQELAEKSTMFGRFRTYQTENIITEVSSRLPGTGLLVELISSRSFLGYGHPEHPTWGTAHYLAIILFPEYHIELIDLGEASVIDSLAFHLMHDLSHSSSDPTPVARALYNQTFAKLLPHLKGRKDVYLSLDGSLHLIPFDALHDGTDYLLGRYKFHYLTSGRDLLRKPSSQPVGPALVIGNPYFGKSANAESEAGSSVYHRLTNLSDLPWAQREAESVAKLLGVRAATGASAKEELLRDRLAPSVVHLATHGLFLTDVTAPMSPGTRSALLLASPPEEKKPASTEPPVSLPGLFGPMNRAALVFANARQGATVEDKSKDGLLTAEEARSLDLDGTQLVVLSACETGQGETSSGQGVYGLRRAFLIAGAETVVTSLWRVHDEATGELMTKYYGKLLDKAHPGDRLGAMIESMQELRARPGREHPYYWAPFLVIGADGPLRHTAMR